MTDKFKIYNILDKDLRFSHQIINKFEFSRDGSPYKTLLLAFILKQGLYHREECRTDRVLQKGTNYLHLMIIAMIEVLNGIL